MDYIADFICVFILYGNLVNFKKRLTGRCNKKFTLKAIYCSQTKIIVIMFSISKQLHFTVILLQIRLRPCSFSPHFKMNLHKGMDFAPSQVAHLQPVYVRWPSHRDLLDHHQSACSSHFLPTKKDKEIIQSQLRSTPACVSNHPTA